MRGVKWIAEMPRRTLPRVGAPGARKAESWTAWARAYPAAAAVLKSTIEISTTGRGADVRGAIADADRAT